MSNVKLRTPSNGSVTLSPQDTASDVVLTVPSTAGSFVTANSSGNVGIGTSSPGSRLQVRTSAGYNVYFETSGTSARLNYLNDAGSANVSATYRATDFAWQKGDGAQTVGIDSVGRLNVGVTSGGGNVNIKATSVNFLTEFYSQTGTSVGSIQTNGTTTSYSTSSDYRLKENVQPMQNALATVAQLNPVTYTWKSDGSDGQGFIAHELQAVVPDCVTGEKDAVRIVDVLDEDGKKIGTKEEPVYQGVDTSFLVATLTKAIQELNAKVEQLEAQIAGSAA